VLLTGGTSDPAGWADAPAHFARLEAAGCSAIWLADHLFWGRPMPEALVMAGVAAAATERCRIGTGVLQVPLRSAPSVAKAAATVQILARGRFVLGVGSGEHATEYERAGASFAGRGRALDVAIDDLRRLWSEGDEAGRFAQRPAPGPIPVWVGGRTPAALERTARRGDGWLPMFLSPERFAEADAELDRRLAAAGRDPGEVDRVPVAAVAVTRRGWSRQDALDWAGRLWSLDPRRLEPHVITGTVAECAIRLGEYRARGAGAVTVLPATDRPIDLLEELNPAYRAETGE